MIRVRFLSALLALLWLAGLAHAERRQREVPFAKNIRRLVRAKRPKGAKIYYHVDLDGVTTAMAMKHFLQKQGITKFEFQGIQYGDREFAVSKPKAGWLPVLVDFAHGKPWMAVHTDHHDSQVGANGVTAFVKAPANAAFVSSLTPRGAFGVPDLRAITMVDSAAYAGKFCPADTRCTVVNLPRGASEQLRALHLGNAVNAKLLAIKNKRTERGGEPHSVMNEMLMRLSGKPSLAALDREIDRAVGKYGLNDARTLRQRSDTFVAEARRLVVAPNITSIATLKSGQSMKLGNIIVQYGANSKMRYGGYSRYAPFEVHPDAHFQTIAWPMGLLQVSKNPFKAGRNPQHLGKMLLGEGGILAKYKSELQRTRISLDRIKYVSERAVTKQEIADAVGYTWSDFTALYKNGQIEGIDVSRDSAQRQKLAKAANKQYRTLTEQERELLKSVSVSAWDLIQASSGGHRDISQISGLNFLPRDFRGGYITFMRELQLDVAKAMRSKELLAP